MRPWYTRRLVDQVVELAAIRQLSTTERRKTQAAMKMVMSSGAALASEPQSSVAKCRRLFCKTKVL